MAEKFSVQAVFTAVDQFSGPVARMSDTLNKFNGKGGVGGKSPRLTNTFREAGEAMGRMGERARSARNTIATVGIAGGFMAHKLITAGASVESALLQGSSKFGDGIRRNTPAFRELENAAFDLGKTTRFGAVEAAGALNELAASGFEPAAAIKNLPIIAEMAIAGGEELQMASNIALDSLGAFGMLYDEMGRLRGPEQLASNLTRVADVMAYTANQTTASMGSIYETLTEAGPITKVAGMTFEKFAAITGALSQVGIKGSQAGTAIKNISVRLLSPTSEGSKELKKLKIDEKSFRKMADPLEQLEVIAKAIERLPKEDQIKALDEYFGKIPLAGASFLANGGFRNARVLEEKILMNSSGSNARQADIIADSTDSKMAMLKNKFEDIGKTIFNEIQSPLEQTIDKVINYLNNNKAEIGQKAFEAVDWVGNNGENIGTAMKVGAYAWAGSAAAGLIHSGVRLVGDLGKIATGVAGVATKTWGALGGANAALKTVSMGRLGVTVAGGLAGAGAGAGLMAVDWQNDELKKSTQGLGIMDLLTGAFRNSDGRGMAGVVDDHQNALARAEFNRLLTRREATGPGVMTGYDAALENSQYGNLLAEDTSPEAIRKWGDKLAESMQVEPLVVPPEAIKVQPLNLQSVFDAIAAQIAASGPGLTPPEEKNAGANQDYADAYSRTDVNVSVEAKPGTRARTTQSTHTKPNNHRTGTN
jgi:TP901 family phage tail tape measure protein